MFDYIFFDLDGTLTDPALGITSACAYALDKFGIKVEDLSTLNKHIGPPLHYSFMEYYGFTHDQATDAVKFYREYYSTKGLYQNIVYDGTVDMLKALKKAGKTLVIATSKPELYSNKILEHFGLDGYFSLVSGAGFTPESAIKSKIIARAIEQLKITDKSNIVMVGDREHDILGAKENGLSSIGVLFGYGSIEELEKAGATFIAKNQKEILKVILGR